MSSKEGDEEVILGAKESIADRMKLNPRKRKITGTALQILTRNKLLEFIYKLLDFQYF